MDRHKVANIISRCRRQKGVQQEVLCRGICSELFPHREWGCRDPAGDGAGFLRTPGRGSRPAGTAIGGGGLRLLSEAAGH